MQALDPSHILTLVMGAGLGIAAFAPLLAVVLMARAKRLRPTVGKGMAALGLSFAFSMAGLGAVWLSAPQDILVVAIGFLVGFLVMWTALAVITMSH